MYNKDITITIAQLSSHNVIVLDQNDVYMKKTKVDARGNVFPVNWIPSEFQILNDTGGEIRLCFLANEQEYLHYQAFPLEHALIRVPAGATFQDDHNMPLSRYILLQGQAGQTYTKDLLIQLLSYGPSLAV